MTQEGALALQEKIGNCKVLFEKRYNSALRNDYDPTSYGEIHHFFYFYPYYRHLSVPATTAGLVDNTAFLNQTESGLAIYMEKILTFLCAANSNHCPQPKK